MRFASRSALKRIGAVALVLAILVALCWWKMIRMPLKSFAGALPELTAEQGALRDELRAHVEKLAVEIGERNVFRPKELQASVDYIESVFKTAGYTVRRQTYAASGETCHNLEAEIRGRAFPHEIIVIGAHYDSVLGSPGANDNGSGVAALLTLARLAQNSAPDRTVRFVAFVNEEPPFFQTEQMGSLVYAKQCRAAGDNIVGMISLETMGCFNSEAGSQRYPFPIGMFYPSRGDFIAFVADSGNAELVRRCIRIFREHVSFPSEGAALPGSLPGINWSDHWSFTQVGYPAIMITDTAPFRYPHYHSANDLPDEMDFGRFARVVHGLQTVITELANSPQ